MSNILNEFKPDVNSDLDNQIQKWIQNTTLELRKYINEYNEYFERNNKLSKEKKTRLDPLPRLILVPGIGLIGLGNDKKSSMVAADIGQAVEPFFQQNQ